VAKARTDDRPRRKTPGPVIVTANGTDAKHLQAILDAQQRGTRPSPLAEIHVFRFRHQLLPFTWLALMAAGPLAALARHPWWGVLAALGTQVCVVIATRHREKFYRWHVQGGVSWAAAWSMALMPLGTGWWLLVTLAGWFIPYCFWLEHYRWKPTTAAAPPPETIEAKFTRLAVTKKWVAWLGPPQPIDNGVQYEICLDGARNAIDKILSCGTDIAATFEKAVTEAFAESHPDGRKHHGLLTLLNSGTLDAVRLWDGIGIDPRTGRAVIGRFPDGKPVHEAFYNLPEDGVKHSIFAGADGSGKTAALNLSLAISASSGYIAPVILDPQEGQALPAWRDVVPYARGIEECMTWLAALHKAMFARSAWMSELEWCREHGDCGRGRCGPACKRRRGMGFFNPFMVDVPIIEITIDEAPILLASKGAAALILDLLKLGRKVGFRLRLAAQVPSLAELKAQEVRSILVGGNVWCGRTGDAVTGGYVNLPNNPRDLPRYFSDGTPTWGLGYASGPDNRPEVTMRTDKLADPYETAESLTIRHPDSLVWDVMADTIEAAGQVLAGIQADAEAASSRQLMILLALANRPMGMGELITELIADMPLTTISTEVDRLIEAGKLRESSGLLEPTGR